MTLEETPETRRPSAVTVELGAFQVETVRSVSGTAFGAAPPDGLPGGAGRPGEITIVRGPDQSAAFTDWLTRCLATRAADRPRQTVTVVHYAADRTPLRRYRLSGALPTTWETPKDGAPTESVTLTYEELTITT